MKRKRIIHKPRGKNLKKIVLLLALCLVVIILVILNIVLNKPFTQKPQSITKSYPYVQSKMFTKDIPITLQDIPNTQLGLFIDPNSSIVRMSIPKDWKVVEHQYWWESNSDVQTYYTATYSANLKEYTLLFGDVYQVNDRIATLHSDKTTKQNMNLGDNTYSVTTFFKDDKKQFIYASPTDNFAQAYISILSIELPPDNTDYYLQTFYSIVSSIPKIQGGHD